MESFVRALLEDKEALLEATKRRDMKTHWEEHQTCSSDIRAKLGGRGDGIRDTRLLRQG